MTGDPSDTEDIGTPSCAAMDRIMGCTCTGPPPSTVMSRVCTLGGRLGGVEFRGGACFGGSPGVDGLGVGLGGGLGGLGDGLGGLSDGLGGGLGDGLGGGLGDGLGRSSRGNPFANSELF